MGLTAVCSAQRDMLRLDALIMTVQLNIRRLLEVRFPVCPAL